MDGHPVQIIHQNEERGTIELDEEALASILLSPEAADKHVCVLAVAGAFRMGKSFLLDFFLRYCANTVDHSSEDWLGTTTTPLTGFKWSNSFERETRGILMWSKPFIMRSATGEQVALLLMDTQGTFDTETSLKDSTQLFALTLMVSSVVVYNLMHNIGEDDLMNLQTFTSYGVQAQEEHGISTTFQKLIFLVRDWGFSSAKPYGSEGGQSALDSVLEIKDGQAPAHQDVRRDLRKCFTELGCYLMPHPGFKAGDDEEFDGRVADLEKRFVEHLRLLVPQLLGPENLVKKEFNGQHIRARDLFDFFKTFTEVLRNVDTLEPSTFAEFAARLSCQKAVEKGMDFYVNTMETLIREKLSRIFTRLEAEHEHVKQKTIALFLENNSFGRRNQRLLDDYKAQLENDVDQKFQCHYAPLVSSKHAEEAALKHYETATKTLIARHVLRPSLFEIKIRTFMIEARNLYETSNTYGKKNPKIYEKHLKQLHAGMEQLFSQYSIVNKNNYDRNQTTEQILQGLAAAVVLGTAAYRHFR